MAVFFVERGELLCGIGEDRYGVLHGGPSLVLDALIEKGGVRTLLGGQVREIARTVLGRSVGQKDRLQRHKEATNDEALVKLASLLEKAVQGLQEEHY